MRFWDASAIVALLGGEPRSNVARATYAEDRDMTVWWAAPVECVSALARREREGVSPDAIVPAFRRLEALRGAWDEIEPAESVRQRATRLLRVHPLRAADSLQLSAAIAAAGDDDRGSVPLVTLDDRLADAAEREGLTVLVPEARAP